MPGRWRTRYFSGAEAESSIAAYVPGEEEQTNNEKIIDVIGRRKVVY
jgi:hypothetical protein